MFFRVGPFCASVKLILRESKIDIYDMKIESGAGRAGRNNRGGAGIAWSGLTHRRGITATERLLYFRIVYSLRAALCQSLSALTPPKLPSLGDGTHLGQ